MQHSGTPEPSAISKNSIAWSLDSLKKSQNQSPVTLDMATSDSNFETQSPLRIELTKT